jgi:cleavage stimulation factor subunit 3
MRFVRRSEGIDAARKVFVSALNDEKVNSFEIYVAGAMMEYQWNKQSQVATKIFNHGMKKFSSNVKYLMGYLEFLNSINDYNSEFLIVYL